MTERMLQLTRMSCKRIAITTGDPAGIGPEISLKAALDPKVCAACNPIVVSDPSVLVRHAEACGIAAELRVVADLDITYGQGFGIGKPQPPWASPSHWVATTLSRRGLRSHVAEEGGEEADETRLAALLTMTK